MTAKPLTLEDAIARTAGIHDTLPAAHPKLARGRVWCIRCKRSQEVDSAQCLAKGWPMCCGATMSIDSPQERKRARPPEPADRL